MECIPWGPFLLFTATQGGLCLPKFSFPSCLGTKTQWPMPCHRVPWHHPVATSSSTTFWKQSFWSPLPFLLPRWHSYRWLPRTWHAGLQSCSSSSPHRDILTLKMSVSSMSEFSLWCLNGWVGDNALLDCLQSIREETRRIIFWVKTGAEFKEKKTTFSAIAPPE